MVSKEENGTISLWLLWGGWALLDKTANRVVSEDTAVVLQEGDGTGAPIRVEVKGKKKGRICTVGNVKNKRSGQAAADGPSWEMMSDN